jgi:uncharacterized phage protein gp47/JayE
MTTYGLTTVGFVPKTYSIIVSELEESFKSVFGASIDVDAQSVFGQMIGILAEREADVWDAAQDVYSAFDPDAATGSALDALAALTGTLREAATHSTVTVTCTGTAGTTIPAGTEFSVAVTGVKFETLADATMDGTFVTVDIDCQSVDTGPLVAATGTLTTIETPVDGLTSVTNAADADLGSDEETDAALRLRREEELRQGANAALEAIREAVLDVDGIAECVVFENTTMVTDSDGIPAKAVNVVVDEGTADEDDIAEAIFGSVAAGIETYGTDKSVSVTDTQGISHTIEWDEADEIACYVTATITYDADEWPTDGEDQAEAAILAYEDTLKMGLDLVGRRCGADIFEISGVLDCVVTVGTAPSPSGASVSIGLRELATLDSARVVIVATAGTP